VSYIRKSVLAIACAIASQVAWSANVTGNPITDGWTKQNNSLATGTFARSSGGSPENALDFDIYARSYSIAPGSNLLFSPNWQVGDTVIGLGFVANSLYNMTASPMIKFGGAASTFAADSNGRLLAPADGLVSMSSGYGGEGSVLIRITTPYGRNGSGDLNTPANNGAFLVPNVMEYFDGSALNVAGNATIADAARIVTLFDTAGTDEAMSFAGLLNISALGRIGSINDLPAIGASSVVSFMRSTGGDGTEAIGFTVPVPEPSAYAMALAGLGLIGWAARRRSAKHAAAAG